VAIVCNGIPDPCPGFKQKLLPRRLARFAARKALSLGIPIGAEALQPDSEDPHHVRVLYLAHCTREKGLFDVLEAIALANSGLALSGSPIRFHLTVAGEFLTASERSEFESRCRRADLQLPETRRQNPCSGGATSAVKYMGFLSREAKERVFVESDFFCFPTFYHAENLPLVLIEAMAFGLPIITTRWRSIPELFPSGYSGLVDVHSPAQIAEAMQTLSVGESGENLRDIFLRQFTLEQHLSGLAKALTSLEIRGEGE
jgi:glycosyltransferase involved in cell wall biosynthesis